MSKNIILLIISGLSLFCFSCKKDNNKDFNKLTAINPLSYTSVVYSSDSDTVYVSTYSGRIAQRINNDPQEKIIIRIDDEIYSLAYIQKRKEIVAATLNSGIIVIKVKKRKITKTLELPDSWANTISVSKDEKYLFTSDLKGNNHIWDIEKAYAEVVLPESLSKKRLKGVDDTNKLYFVSNGKAFVWDIENDIFENELSIGYNSLIDIDNQGNILLFNHNNALFFNRKQDSIAFTVSHPNWIFFDSRDKMLGEIPLSMKLTAGKSVKGRFFTAGIDRSIRVWNTESGDLIDSWTGHRATISDMVLNKDHTQLVSVDLKGIIKFWDLGE